MATDRRGFFAQIGTGFAAVAVAYAARPLTALGVEIPSKALPKSVTPEKIQELMSPPADPMILRIAHPTSNWVQNGGAKSGELFKHEYLGTECVNLGPSVECTGYRCVGFKAMKFNSRVIGAEPEAVYTDPESPGFQAVVENSELYYGAYGIYGPVFLFTLESGEILEMFCSNKSSRKFATELGSEPYKGRCTLKSEKVQAKDFVWYCPAIIKHG